MKVEILNKRMEIKTNVKSVDNLGTIERHVEMYPKKLKINISFFISPKFFILIVRIYIFY